MSVNGHARLGLSNHRWPNCPGSVREEAVYPDIPGAAAIDGTGSHLLLEMCLLEGVSANHFDRQIIGVGHEDSPNGWLVDPERVNRVQMCIDYINRRHVELSAQFPGCTIEVQSESKSDPGGMFGRDDWWGTSDVVILMMNGSVCVFAEIIDYKDGRGWVNAENNTQLIGNLAGKLRPFIASGPELVRPFRTRDIQGCRMTIAQPKTNPVIRYDDKPADWVINEAAKLATAAHRTDDPDAPLIPDGKNGKGYCRWCKHKPNCSALNSAGIEAINNMTNLTETNGGPLIELLQNSVMNITEMTVDQLADLYDAEPVVNGIFDKIKTEIENRLDQGVEVPGYEKQNGNKQRVWNGTEEEIVKMLKGRRLKKEEIYPAKLASPAQIMKSENLDEKQKAKIEKDFITEKFGAKKLVRVGRQQKNIGMMFADVPKIEEQPSEPAPVSFF